MPNKRIEKKPSDTALFAALHRAMANKEFKNKKFGSDILAKHFLPPHFKFFLKFKMMRNHIKNKLNRYLPGLYEYMIARTVFFDRLFLDALNSKMTQIILLGAGYDSRSYRFMKLNQGTKIFELDVKPTQARKIKCLRKAQIDIPGHVAFVPINFNQESLKDVLEKAGYDNRQKSLFIWEGISYYLNKESVDTTLKFVSRATHAESTLAFDYTIPVTEKNIDDLYGVKEFVQTMKKRHAYEDLIFSLDESEMKTFIDQSGLKIMDHLNKEQIEKTFLLDEKNRFLGQITGHFRFLQASQSVHK